MKKIMDMNPAQMSEEDIDQWLGIINEFKTNLHLDPSSEKAWQLTTRWLNAGREYV